MPDAERPPSRSLDSQADLRTTAAAGACAIGARMPMPAAAFVPFFAFREPGRVLGAPRLAGVFFSTPAVAAAGSQAGGAGRRPGTEHGAGSTSSADAVVGDVRQRQHGESAAGD